MSLPPVPADAWRILGMPIWVTLPASRTGGRLTVLEHVADPGQGPPLHVHTHEDEAFYILAGRFRTRFGDLVADAGPGESIFLPRGIPHTWKCLGPEPGRLLIVITPSGFENFFAACHAEGLEMPDGAARMAAISEALGCRFVGPPLD
jgi:quercetin dioxygenase-like cupin family protein